MKDTSDFEKNLKKSSLAKDKTLKEKEAAISLNKLEDFWRKNKNTVITVALISAVVIIAAILIINSVSSHNKEKKEEADLAIQKILPYYNNQLYDIALYGDSSSFNTEREVIGLVKIVEEYEGTDQGKLAALYAGKSFYILNKPDEAQKYFKIALKSPSKTVQVGANAGLGVCIEAQGDYKAAIDYYTEAAKLAIDAPTRNRYQYYSALCYEKLGDKEKVSQICNEIIAEGRSEFVGWSKALLTRLGIKID